MSTDNIITTRAVAALRSFFVGDALSMPVHWFYNPLDIQRAFPGGITQMEAAPAFHPSSIMSLHSTNAGGRGAQNSDSGQEVVGDVILKDKRKFWGTPNQHYHHPNQVVKIPSLVYWVRHQSNQLAIQSLGPSSISQSINQPVDHSTNHLTDQSN